MSKVLLITISFRDYVQRIQRALEMVSNNDADVLSIGNYTHGFSYILNKFTAGKRDRKIDFKKQSQFFKNKKDIKYDYIVVIVGRGLNVNAFESFLRIQKHAVKILYLWDDTGRVKEFDVIRHLFDKIYSFDPVDCKKYGMIYLPLFYCNEYRYANEEKEIDFFCTGALHSEREEIIKKIRKSYPDNEYNWHILLSTTPMHIVSEYYLHFRKKSDFVAAKSYALRENALLLKKSRAAVDVRYISQNGLTIRTFECLAARTKMITASRNIAEYDFYNPQNICIINRSSPKIPRTFIESPYEDVDEKLLEKYSIDRWAEKLLMG